MSQRYTHSHEEVLEKAKDWMLFIYGKPKDMSPEQRERYYERLGILVDFVGTICPPEFSDEKFKKLTSY